jgi:TniQ
VTAPTSPRWPLHPPPSAGEALTSWTARLAALYGMTSGYLLRHGLGGASVLLDDPRAGDLDFDPPAEVLQVLAERTGVDPGVVALTTIAGWVPWLAGSLDPYDGQEAFDSYVRQHSVLLAPGEAGRNLVEQWVPWIRAHDQEWRTELRACPACAADPARGTSLLAMLPIMTTCGEHGLRLQTEVAIRVAAIDPDPEPASPVPGPVAAMDRLTFEGVVTGRVTLPGRPVHVGVWFRLLRILLDEVSMPASRVRARSAAAIAKIWEATGRPPRGGLTVWRPYERLALPLQQAMLEAAATALSLAAAGEITARGTLGRCLAPEPHRTVYGGDRQAWEEKQARAECEAMIDRARDDPVTARRVLEMLTIGCRTIAGFYREHEYLVGRGIPWELLPDHRTLGRTDLRP